MVKWFDHYALLGCCVLIEPAHAPPQRGIFYAKKESMDVSTVSFIRQTELGEEENFLLEYSEEEREKNEINREHSKHVINWSYLTIDRYVFDLGLSGNEAIIFSFIYSMLLRGSGKFFFQNASLAGMFNISENTVSNIVNSLKERGLISVSHRRKASGGRIRFVKLAMPRPKNWEYQIPKIGSSKSQKLVGSINNTNNNKSERGGGSPHSPQTYSEILEACRSKVKDIALDLGLYEEEVLTCAKELAGNFAGTGKNLTNPPARLVQWCIQEIKAGRLESSK